MKMITEKEFLCGKHDKEVKDLLVGGGIVIFPSENSYGFAANALDAKVVKKIHDTKKEPYDKPIGLIIDKAEKIEWFSVMNKKSKKLLGAKLSGPLSVVYEVKKDKVSQTPFTCNGFVGARIPLRESLVKMCSLVDFPLTAPSANIHGEPAIFDSKKIKEVFGKEDFLLIDAGKLDETQKPSTYYCTREDKILRQGQVTLDEINRVLRKK